MKKALSLFLAVLTIFGCLGIGAAADSYAPTPWHGEEGSGKPATYEQTVLTFDANGGTFKNSMLVYDTNTGSFTWSEAGKLTGTWAMVPQEPTAQIPGYYVTLPVVDAPKGYQFAGWFCYLDGNTYGANSNFKIPEGTAGTVIEFRAAHIPTEPEEDTMATVMGVLIKVFGAIIGILMYRGDTEAGVALMEKILGGIL